MTTVSFFSQGTLLALLLNALLNTACAQRSTRDSASSSEESAQDVGRIRSLRPFTSLAVSGPWRVEVRLGAEHSLKLEGSEKAFERLEVKQTDNGLSLGMVNGMASWNWTRGEEGRIIVTTVTLNELAVSGSGDVSLESTLKTTSFQLGVSGSANVKLPLEVQNLEVGLSGSGNLALKGSAGKMNIGVSGSGDVNAEEMQCRDVNVGVSGSGSVNVSVTESLNASASGSGNVRYRGNPGKVNSKTTGSGSISAD